MGAAKQHRMLDVGAQAPDFQLSDLSGERYSLKDMLASGPVVLAFFKVSCPVCQLTFPFLDRIYRGESLKVFGISQDDTNASREFNEEFGVTFPALLDLERESYPASNAFGIACVPSVFLVEPGGKISWTMEGFVKKDLEELGARAGVKPFQPGERVPEAKAG
jgi:peroxiredoxin